MNQEQLAFVNQQLAGMLRAGLPLEGALAQLSRDLRAGPLKRELEALQEDLAQGVPAAEAVESRRFPELYRRVVGLGLRGQDLPGALALLGDYYQRAHLLWTRLKGLMAYPILVLAGCAALAAFVAWMFSALAKGGFGAADLMGGGYVGQEPMRHELLRLWAPALGFGLMTLGAVLAVFLPGVRRHLRWHLPGFREGALANLAETFHLLLVRGCSLGDAVDLLQGVEAGSPAGRELAHWSKRIAGGEGKPSQFAREGRVLPPLFRWLISQGGEDLAAGFKRAADLYHARAMYRTDLLLYLALPVSVMFLGLLILVQFYPLMRIMVLQLDVLGS